MVIRKSEKISSGILIMSIIQLISAIFSIIGYIFFILIKDQINKLNTLGGEEQISNAQLFIFIFITLIIIAAVILILAKKKVGIYVYISSVITNVIYNIIMNGINLFNISLSIIIPILLMIFIIKNKCIYGIGSNINQ